MLDAEADEITGAARYSAKPANERKLTAKAGRLELKVPSQNGGAIL